jgi:hypothetical protein
VWDPFVVLCLPHDPSLGWWPVRRAYWRRLRLAARTEDDERRAVEAHRVKVAYRVLRSQERRDQVLVDLAIQPGWWASLGLTYPDVAAKAEAALPPLWDGEGGLELALDRRALERDRAALRLERAEAGVLPWPRSRLGRCLLWLWG